MKKNIIDNVNIKIFLVVLSFYSTIIQSILNIHYLTFGIFILIFIISYKEIIKKFSIVKKNEYFLFVPIFFLIYIIIQCFYYTDNLNYDAIYIIGSFFFSIFYLYFFFFYSINKNFLFNFYKILYYFNFFTIVFVLSSKVLSELNSFYNFQIDFKNFHEVFITSYFSMIINIFSVFYLIKNISVRFFNIPLLSFILFIFFSAELKIIFFIICFIVISLIVSKFKNRYVNANSLIIFFISIIFFLSKVPGVNKKFNFFSTYSLNARIEHFIENDYSILKKNYNEKEFNIFSNDQIHQIDKQSKSLSSRITSYLLFYKQISESNLTEFLFGRGPFFNGRFYFHNFYLDIFIKFGFIPILMWVFYTLLFAVKYVFLIKKDLNKFLFSTHFYCFFLFIYFNVSFAAWHSKFLFAFLGISYFLIKHKKSDTF